ncbi:MAG TPA: hypothetical protein VFE58_07330 [Tepidisphaeraceae bacterium]|jgi:polyhydroxybutyrate depolymerase|nr:hypothetical protein [Tepidisphaeraceae bacterium]
MKIPTPAIFLLLLTTLSAAPTTKPTLQKLTWQVDGTPREALVYLPPESSSPTPILFFFHGHGANAQFSARKFPPNLWPTTIFVYPQGLPTKTPVDPEGKLPGWQRSPGIEHDRDLHFFDAMLKSLIADHHADPKNVFVAGHSNGAFFTYTLLSARPDSLTAIAPIAGLLSEQDALTAKPKPIFHIAGQKDPKVHFPDQQLTIQRDLTLNHCSPDTHTTPSPMITIYPSTTPDGPPLQTLIHPGGHEIPKSAPEQIIQFFQEHSSK